MLLRLRRGRVKQNARAFAGSIERVIGTVEAQPAVRSRAIRFDVRPGTAARIARLSGGIGLYMRNTQLLAEKRSFVKP